MLNLKILVVDDDPIIGEILETILESEGYQVILVSNGSDAIAALHRGKFDLVITDLQMDDPDGFAVIKKVKNSNPFTKRMVITSNKDISSVIKAIKIGVEAYLLKPFSRSELLYCVSKCIDKLKLNRKTASKDLEISSSEEDRLPVFKNGLAISGNLPDKLFMQMGW